MNGTVWAFGDSFTKGICEEEGSIGRTVESPYAKIIANKLEMSYINKARELMSFQDIFATITKHLQYIKKGDIVIAGTTSLYRIMYPAPYEYVKDYHGTEDSGEYSLTGLNIPAIEVIKTNYKYLKGFNEKFMQRFFIDWWENIVLPNEDAFHKFYDDYYKNWCSYFTSIEVPFYWWDNMWTYFPYAEKCECGHWTQNFHNEFANKLLSFMEDNKSGKLPDYGNIH